MAGGAGYVAVAIRLRGHVLVLASGQRPDLPAVQTVAVADVDDGEQIIVGDHVAFARFAKEREQDEYISLRNSRFLRCPQNGTKAV